MVQLYQVGKSWPSKNLLNEITDIEWWLKLKVDSGFLGKKGQPTAHAAPPPKTNKPRSSRHGEGKVIQRSKHLYIIQVVFALTIPSNMYT